MRSVARVRQANLTSFPLRLNARLVTGALSSVTGLSVPSRGNLPNGYPSGPHLGAPLWLVKRE